MNRDISPKQTASAKRQTVSIAIAVMMAITAVAGCLAEFSLGKYLNEASYLRLLITDIEMLFAFALFIGCCFSFREDTMQRRSFTAATVLLYFCILLSGVFDLLDGTPGRQRQLMVLQSVISLLSVMVHLVIWNYQCASLPENRMRRFFSTLIHLQATIYVVLIIVNLFSGFLFYADESGRTHYPGEMIEVLCSFGFYLAYLFFILLQRCPLRKKLSLAAFAVFPFLCMLFTLIWYE